jgi:carbamoyltransferase
MAAAQEERFTRKKTIHHFQKMPLAIVDKPFLKFERLMETYLALAPRGFRSFQMAMPRG